MRKFVTALTMALAFIWRCPQAPSQVSPPTSYSVSATPTPAPTQIYVSSQTPGSYGPYTFWVAVNYPQGQSALSNPVTVSNFGYPLVITFARQAGATGYSCIFSSEGGSLPENLMSAGSVQGNTCVLTTLASAGNYVTPAPLPAVYTFASGNSSSPATALTGAVTDAGGQVFNVKAYGATGNGSIDDTQAVNAAITAVCANGGTLYFPPGNYAILSGNLTVCPSNGPSASIEGAGAGVSTISFGAAAGGLIVGYSVPAFRAVVRDISITAANPTGIALILGNGSAGAEGIVIEGVSVSSPGTALAFGANTFLTSVYSSSISGNVEIETPSTSGENISFYGTVFTHYSASAASVTIQPSSGTLQTSFFGCSFDGSQVFVVGAQAHFYGGHWEDTATSSSPYFLVAGNGTASTEVTISGGTMNDDGKYPAGSFFHVESGSQLSVVGGFQPCSSVAFFTVINADAGSTAYLSDMQVPNCGGYPNHPLAITGAGSIAQGQNGAGVASMFSLPLYMTGGINISSGSGAPSGTCQSGSLYLNSSGASGSTLYACISSAWADVK